MAPLKRNDLPRSPSGRALLSVAVFVVLCAAVAPLWLGLGTQRLLIEIFVVLAMAQMWNLLAGYGGLMSIGHQAFVGVGAYSFFAFSNFSGVSPYLSLAIAPLTCAVLAAMLAPFLFRLRDAYFSIAMWVVAEVIAIAVGNSSMLGRQFGMTLIGMRGSDPEQAGLIMFWLGAAVALGSILLVYFLLRSSLGLGLMAVRDNDSAAAGLGVDVWRMRFIAFVISASGCGLAGAIYYMSALQVVPTSGFDVNWVVEMLFVTVVGGMGRIEGPIIGVVIYFGLRELFAASGNWYLILFGTVAIVAMLIAPKGIWGTFSNRFRVELLSVRRTPPDRSDQTENRRLDRK